MAGLMRGVIGRRANQVLRSRRLDLVRRPQLRIGWRVRQRSRLDDDTDSWAFSSRRSVRPSRVRIANREGALGAVRPVPERPSNNDPAEPPRTRMASPSLDQP